MKRIISLTFISLKRILSVVNCMLTTIERVNGMIVFLKKTDHNPEYTLFRENMF